MKTKPLDGALKAHHDAFIAEKTRLKGLRLSINEVG